MKKFIVIISFIISIFCVQTVFADNFAMILTPDGRFIGPYHSETSINKIVTYIEKDRKEHNFTNYVYAVYRSNNMNDYYFVSPSNKTLPEINTFTNEPININIPQYNSTFDLLVSANSPTYKGPNIIYAPRTFYTYIPKDYFNFNNTGILYPYRKYPINKVEIQIAEDSSTSESIIYSPAVQIKRGITNGS